MSLLTNRVWIVLFFLLFFKSFSLADERCNKPWMFFDVGNTLVDTKTYNYNPMFYLRDVKNYDDGYQNAKEYIDALVSANYRLGAIVDIPEQWGTDEGSKIRSLKAFIAGTLAGEKTSWKDDVSRSMNWSPFDGQIYLPQKDSERKSELSLVLFRRAVRAAAGRNCKAVYQGENAAEMGLAEKAGMIPFQVGVTSKSYFYLPLDQIQKYVDSYRSGGWNSQRD